MAPQHSFTAERIDNTFCTYMKGWNKMFLAVIIVEVYIFRNTPGKLLDGRASLFLQYFDYFDLSFFKNTYTIMLYLFQGNHMHYEFFH